MTKKTLIAMVFAAASVPMMFAQATTPTKGKTMQTTKKHHRGKKAAPKTGAKATK